MKELWINLKGETLKMKRSGNLILSFLIGAGLPVAFLMVKIFDNKGYDRPVSPGTNYYFENFEITLIGLAGFFLPLLIIINASKIAQIDHKNKGWHLMETQPVSKWSIYIAKYLLILLNVARTLFIYATASIICGYILTQFIEINPSYDMSIPAGDMGYILVRLFIASLAIAALQYVISVLVPSFIWSLVIGFTLLLSQLILSDTGFDLRWHPYNFISVSADNIAGSQLGRFLIKAEWLSLVYSIGLLYVGFYRYKFKSFYVAFAKAAPRTIFSIIVIACAAVSSYLILAPNTLEPFTKTIIKGTVKSDIPISHLYLLEDVTLDTIATLAVNEGNFRSEISQKLSPDYYLLQVGNMSRNSLFMSTNDSIQIDYSLYGSQAKLEVTGTRIPENIQTFTRSDSFMIDYYLNNKKLDDPEFFEEQITRYYLEELSNLNGMITVDHLTPKDDFLNLSRQLIAVKHMGNWNKYVKKAGLYYPKLNITSPKSINDIANAIDLENDALVDQMSYINYVISETRKKLNDPDATDLEIIKTMNGGVFKDKLVYTVLLREIEEAELSSTRNELFSKYASQISNRDYIINLNSLKTKFNQLSKGNPIMDIAMIDKDGKNYTLADFNGNYVVIDTWASWCGPCKQQEPFLVKTFMKFKDEKIVFISLNTDSKEQNWREDLVDMNQEILQLRPLNIMEYMNNYKVESIPRFMLISPESTIEDAYFVRPTENAFDEILDLKLNIDRTS
jgi:thiol-disulfide isomerase/thioredoxin